MEKLGGYVGSILHVDLADKSITRKPLSFKMMKGFIGGEGINARLAYELIARGEAPFSPRNALIFGAGPFVGTMIPGASKSNFTGKSPSSGFMGTRGTGHFGMLKFVGYDHLVVTGNADKPVYLKMLDDDVRIYDADNMWGRDVWEATEAIWDKEGEEYVVACIGPAGENLVKDASIIVDKYSAFARTGLGAVMGSKNLKAIAAYGTKGIRVADPKQFEGLLAEVHTAVMGYDNLEAWRNCGTLALLEEVNKQGRMPYKNYSAAAGEEVLEVFDLKVFLKKMKEGNIACMSCPVGCKKRLRLKEGKYIGLTVPIACFAAPTMYFGTGCAIEDWPEVLKCAELANRLGLDWISTAALIGFGIELYQSGTINKKDTEGLELDWGAANNIQELMRRIADRKGFGKILSEGLVEASRHIGRDSEDHALSIKGIAPPLDCRVNAASPSLFCQLTNVKGHPSFYDVGIRMLENPALMEEKCRKMGVPESVINNLVTDPEGNLGRITKWADDYAQTMESLGMCRHLMFGFHLDLCAHLYTALTGIQMSAGDLIEAAGRVWDVKRAFNLREGASREDDAAPGRFMVEPLKMGSEIRDPVDRGYVEKMITQYYEERGWDPTQGTVEDERLKAILKFY